VSVDLAIFLGDNKKKRRKGENLTDSRKFSPSVETGNPLSYQKGKEKTRDSSPAAISLPYGRLLDLEKGGGRRKKRGKKR